MELAIAYQAAAIFGWSDLGATHFSCRLPGRDDHFLMLRQGLFFEEVTADNLIKIDLAGHVVGGAEGGQANPAGVTIHAGMYANAPTLGAIMHTHTRAGIAVSAHPEGLLPISQHALKFYGRTSRHTFEGLVLDDCEGPTLVKDLGDNQLLLLDNHGLLTVGADVPTAFSVLYQAEFSARAQVDALAMTSEPIRPSPTVCEHTARQHAASTGSQYRDWLGIVRMVGRSRP